MIVVSLAARRYAECRKIAERRSSRPRSSTRALSPEWEFIGIVAEEAFGTLIHEHGPKFNPAMHDGGSDFKTPVGTIDVKGNGPRVRPLYVVADRGPLKCDFYVLASVRLDLNRERPPVVLVGFAHRSEVLAIPPKDTGKTFSHVLEYVHPPEPLVHEIRRAKGLDP